jgi:flagellar protein FlaF
LEGIQVNAQILARSVYGSAVVPTRTERSTEYELFAQITHRLKAALLKKDDFNAMVRALHDNRSLWTTLAADVSVSTNALPAALRAQIFYLGEFTQHQSRRVLSGDGSADVLVEINTMVMRGLRASGDGS